MAKSFTITDRVTVLWEAGIRKAKTIAKRLNIPERTAYGHVAKLKK